jgi:hypothetical protein
MTYDQVISQLNDSVTVTKRPYDRMALQPNNPQSNDPATKHRRPVVAC